MIIGSSNTNSSKYGKWIIGLSLLQVAFMFWLPDSGYDKYFWETWTKDIMTNGLGAIYLNPEADNHPLNMYLMKVLSWFFSEPSAVNPTTVNWLKALVFPFNLATILGVLYLVWNTGCSVTKMGWLFLNPAFWYNTIVWGQLDVIYTFFAFIALILAERGRWKWAWATALIAINFKLQAIVVFPLILILTYQDVLRASWGNRIKGLWILIGLQTLIFVPFILSGNIYETLHALSTRSIDRYPVIARQAFNVWHYFFADPFNTPDSVKILRIPMKIWGLVLFGLASLMNMSLLALSIFNRAFDNLSRWQRMIAIFQVAALISIAFFLFNTQMHERYIHPAVLFSFIPFILYGDKVVYFLISLAYLLNMEAVMQMVGYYSQRMSGVELDYANIWIFNPVLIATLILLAYVWGTIAHAKQFLSYRNTVSHIIITT